MATDVTLVRLPLPPRELQPNRQRGHHWGKTTAARKMYRLVAKTIIARAFEWKRPMYTHARLELAFSFETKRQRDEDNLIAWCKPVFDAMEDAGVVENDKDISIGAVGCRVDQTEGLVVVILGDFPPRGHAPDFTKWGK